MPRSTTTSRRLTHNALFNVLALLITAAIQFFLIRFLLGELGEIRYGVWVLVGSIFAYRRLLSIGMNSAIDMHIPRSLAENDSEAIGRIFATSFVFYSFLSVIVILITVLLYRNLGSWFTIEPEVVGVAQKLILIVGVCAAAGLCLQPSAAILSGLQRYGLINLATVTPLLLQTVLVVWLVTKGCGLIAIGVTFGLAEIARSVLLFIFIRILLPHIPIRLANFDRRLLAKMLPYGIRTFMFTMGSLVITKIGDVIIGMFIGTAQVSQFAVAAAAVLFLSSALGAFTIAIKPAVTDLDARNQQVKVRELAFLSRKYSLILIIPSACFFIVMGRDFLSVWMGDRFEDPGVIESLAVVLSILTVGHCFRFAQEASFRILAGRDEHGAFSVLAVVMAIMCTICSVIAAKVLDGGLIAVAWAISLPMLGIAGIVMPAYFNWKMRISPRDCLTKVWWPVALACSPVVAMIGLWKYLSPPDRWLELGAVVICSALLTLASTWCLGLGAAERKRFVSMFLPANSRLGHILADLRRC